MQLLYIVVALAGGAYLLGVRRRPDAFTVAFFSAAIYFLPAIAGYTLSPTSPRSPVKLPVTIEPEAMLIMAAVTSIIVLATMAWDRLDQARPPPNWVLEDSGLAAWIALALGTIGVAGTVLESGGAAFTADKSEVIELVGRGHLLWQMGATLGTVLAYVRRQRLAAVVGWVLLALDMWIGFRYAFATTFIAIGLLWLSRSGPVRLGAIRLRYVAVILAGGLFLISFQNLKEPLRAGDWAEIQVRLGNPLWYVNGILTSEPFTTQTVLNEIVRNDFHTSSEHLVAASYHLILFAPALGEEAVRFNKVYQPALFPLVDHGLANNIWAQMWSAGGWPLLVAFTLVFVLVLGVWSRLLRSADPAVRSYAAIAAAYWGFYLHRNELMGVVGSQKQLLLVTIACIALAILVARVARNIDRSRPAMAED
ncbi:MAG: hypothetical protein J0M16_06835 [Gammaproteobacteria bacterium]|nr:hypothetical protein [Gammaproteobacteria bacterium]